MEKLNKERRKISRRDFAFGTMLSAIGGSVASSSSQTQAEQSSLSYQRRSARGWSSGWAIGSVDVCPASFGTLDVELPKHFRCLGRRWGARNCGRPPALLSASA